MIEKRISQNFLSLFSNKVELNINDVINKIILNFTPIAKNHLGKVSSVKFHLNSRFMRHQQNQRCRIKNYEKSKASPRRENKKADNSFAFAIHYSESLWRINEEKASREELSSPRVPEELLCKWSQLCEWTLQRLKLESRLHLKAPPDNRHPSPATARQTEKSPSAQNISRVFFAHTF